MAPIKLKYSEQYIRKAIRSHWLEHDGLTYLIILTLLTVLLVYRIAIDDLTWIAGALGFGIILGFVLMVITYIDYISQSLSQLRSMNVPEATLELEEEQFRITSDVGTSEIAWNLIRDIWHFDKVWFLMFSRHKIT